MHSYRIPVSFLPRKLRTIAVVLILLKVRDTVRETRLSNPKTRYHISAMPYFVSRNFSISSTRKVDHIALCKKKDPFLTLEKVFLCLICQIKNNCRNIFNLNSPFDGSKGFQESSRRDSHAIEMNYFGRSCDF